MNNETDGESIDKILQKCSAMGMQYGHFPPYSRVLKGATWDEEEVFRFRVCGLKGQFVLIEYQGATVTETRQGSTFCEYTGGHVTWVEHVQVPKTEYVPGDWLLQCVNTYNNMAFHKEARS